MKHIAIIFVTSLLASCNLFQKTQPAGESVVVEEAQKQQEEVFVPVEKELYVISPTALRYRVPDIHSDPEEEEHSFGNLFEIEAESEHFYKIKRNWDWYLRKEDMGSYEDIRFTKEVLEDVHFIGKSIYKYDKYNNCIYEAKFFRDSLDYLIERNFTYYE